jgi:hypothetical protein
MEDWMKRDFAINLTGWLFIVAALMFWGGWMLMPIHIGVFFKPEDFPSIYAICAFGSGCTGYISSVWSSPFFAWLLSELCWQGRKAAFWHGQVWQWAQQAL